MTGADAPMRVLQLSLGINHMILAELAERIAERGHHTHLLIAGTARLLAERLPGGVTPVEGTAADDAIAVLAAAWRPDVVLYHDPWSRELVERLGGERPVVGFMHNLSCPGGRLLRRGDRVCRRTLGWGCLRHWYSGPCGPGPSPRRAVAEVGAHLERRTLLRRLPAVFAASAFMRDHLLSEGLEPARVTVVDAGYRVPPPAAAPAPAGAPAHRARSRPLVLAAGRLTPHKGLHHLLHALAQPGLEGVDAAIVGEGHDRPRLESIARRLGANRVTFAGWADGAELEGWYRRASLLAVPSVWPEPLGTVVAEASRCGLRAVVSDRGALPEWAGIVGGTSVVDVTDHRRFAQAILEGLRGGPPEGGPPPADRQPVADALAAVVAGTPGGGRPDAPGASPTPAAGGAR